MLESLAISEAELYSKLVDWFRSKNGVMIAFSGGVDSTLVAVAARDALGGRAIAVTVKSPLSPPGEIEEASRLAKKLGIKHTVIVVNKIEGVIRKNPPNRCYFCKKGLFRELKRMAEKLQLTVIVDGTNADDVKGHRPGFLACVEEGVKTPLVELGIGKNDVKRISRFLGLPTADKPSMACLASRIPYGEEITEEKLSMIAKAETFIRKRVGIKQLRVRVHRDIARVEVGRSERSKFFNENLLDEVHEKLRLLGFKYVTLDMFGYRTGSMDEFIKKSIPANKGTSDD